MSAINLQLGFNDENLIFDSTAESKIQLLELAKHMRSVSAACRKMKVARSTYYEIKKMFDDMGVKGLEPKRPTVIGKPKATTLEQEEIILKYTKLHPSYSYLILEEVIQNQGHQIRAGHIRVVWRKFKLNKLKDRIAWSSVEESVY